MVSQTLGSKWTPDSPCPAPSLLMSFTWLYRELPTTHIQGIILFIPHSSLLFHSLTSWFYLQNVCQICVLCLCCLFLAQVGPFSCLDCSNETQYTRLLLFSTAFLLLWQSSAVTIECCYGLHVVCPLKFKCL